MFNNNGSLEDRLEKNHRQMTLFGRVFMVVWVLMFVGILGLWGLGGYLQYQCYSSQDPNSFACWYVSDRVEIGVRQR